jgi:hypothetical protein
MAVGAGTAGITGTIGINTVAGDTVAGTTGIRITMAAAGGGIIGTTGTTGITGITGISGDRQKGAPAPFFLRLRTGEPNAAKT